MALLVKALNHWNVPQILRPGLNGSGRVGRGALVVETRSMSNGNSGQSDNQGEAGSGKDGFHEFAP